MKKAVLILSWLVIALPCAGEIIIVDDGGYGDFDNIQAAIDYSNDGDIIYVLPGTYTGPGNRDINYGGRAITVTGVDPQDPYIVAATVIDCNGAGRGFYFHTGEEANSVLAGLTITNGYADYGGGIYCDSSGPAITNCIISNSTATAHGGGMYLCPPPYPYVSHTVANCEITGNDATYGGGVYLCDGTLSSCVITQNISSQSGGGVYCADGTVSECVITGNTALGSPTAYFWHGGGGLYLFYGTVRDCNVSENSASNGCGGAVCSTSLRQPTTINRCTIRGNWSYCNGGGLYLCDRVTNCVITGNATAVQPLGWGYGGGLSDCVDVANCIITGNTACRGGGIYDSLRLVSNCLISGNHAQSDGGGIYYRHPYFVYPARILSSTISGNAAVTGTGGGVYCSYLFSNTNPIVTDTIVWGNTDSGSPVELAQFYATDPEVWFSCIQDDDPNDANIPFGGADHNNIDDNPIFVRDPNDGGDGWGNDSTTPEVNEGANDDYGDLHLTAASPCIDTGDPCFSWWMIEEDIDGDPRVMAARLDMGADEFLVPSISVITPRGGEVWAGGSTQRIKWESYGLGGTLDILYSSNNGADWLEIQSLVVDTGRYTWELPGEVDSNLCVIAIVPSLPDPNVICVESGLFTIHPDSPGPSVTSRWKSLGGDYDRRGLSEDYGPELGCVKWTFETGGPIPASITIGAYDRVHVPCEDGNVYTLDANGVLLWSYDTNSAVLSAASVGPDGTIYVGTESGRLYAIDVNGDVRWTHDAEGFIYSSPAVSPDGNSTYVCSSDGMLSALGRDGSVLWTFQTKDTTGIGSSIFASPALGPDGTVYIAAVRDPNLYALDPNDGSVKWACNFEYLIHPVFPDVGTYFGWALASPVVGPDGTIYQTLLYDPNLYAIDPNTGAILWSAQMGRYRPYRDSDGWSEPAVGPDGTIYFGASDANLWAVDPNGDTRWKTRLGMTTGLTLTVGSKGLIYAADNDGWLCVVDPNGNELSRFYSGGWLNSPVISADNTVIIADVNNKVWAIGGADCGEGPFELHRPEDLNGSLLVNFEDFALLAADWPNSKNPYFEYWPYPWPPYEWDGTYFAGDIDRNLDVDLADVAAMANRWLSGD